MQQLASGRTLTRRAVLGGLAVGATMVGTAGLSLAQAARGLAGVFPIGFTPEKADGAVDFDGLAAQVDFCRRGGVHGLAWPQYASAWPALSSAERITGAETLVRAAAGGRTAIVIGVQSRDDSFVETERYARHAERIGADGIICLPPGLTDPSKAIALSPPQLLAFYQRLGKVTSLPLFAQTGGDFSVDLLVEMTDTIPTFRYVKDEAGDPLKRVGEITRRTGGRLKCFSGNGVTTMITEMELGFSGHCPFTSLADLFASAFELFHAGRRREAFEQFGRIEAASSMFSQSNVNVLVARGVFKPRTRLRSAHPAAVTLAATAAAAISADEIRRILDDYLKPYLRA